MRGPAPAGPKAGSGGSVLQRCGTGRGAPQHGGCAFLPHDLRRAVKHVFVLACGAGEQMSGCRCGRQRMGGSSSPHQNRAGFRRAAYSPPLAQHHARLEHIQRIHTQPPNGRPQQAPNAAAPPPTLGSIQHHARLEHVQRRGDQAGEGARHRAEHRVLPRVQVARVLQHQPLVAVGNGEQQRRGGTGWGGVGGGEASRQAWRSAVGAGRRGGGPVGRLPAARRLGTRMRSWARSASGTGPQPAAAGGGGAGMQPGMAPGAARLHRGAAWRVSGAANRPTWT